MRTRSTPSVFIVRNLLLFCSMLVLAGCGSGTLYSASGSPPPGSSNPPPEPPPPGGLPDPPPTTPLPTTVDLSGTITYDRVPFSAAIGTGLDYAATTQEPIQGVPVELIASADGSVLGTTTTGVDGTYSFPDVPVNIGVRLRVHAQMVKTGTPSWDVTIRDNTNGDEPYVFDGAEFATGIAETLTSDLNAPSGWDDASGAYTADRSAAPFAMLDVVRRAQELVLTADAAIVFPPLNIYWSPNNTPTIDTGNPSTDYPQGDIETTQYIPGGNAIYVLGSADEDTDEYDTHVIAYEWANYYVDLFSRTDSLGGRLTTRLDLRNAFAEGFLFAMSGMILNDPQYRDSAGAGQGADAGEQGTDPTNFETDVVGLPGWYGYSSIAAIVWDLFDSTNEGPDDQATIPFSSIHATMVNEVRNTSAFASIYPFINGLRAREPGLDAQIQAVVTAQNIVPVHVQPNDFAPNETNNMGQPVNLPLYTAISIDGGVRFACVNGSDERYYNSTENRRFMRFTVGASPQNVTINAVSDDPDGDPDIFLWHRGELVATAEDFGDVESLTTTVPLDALETYVIEIFESSNVYEDPSPPFQGLGYTCITVDVDS